MPQLDITINLIWYLCSIIGLGVLYLQNIYIYIPFFVRYWKFNNYYKIYMTLFSLYIYNIYLNFLSTNQYYLVSCANIPYVLNSCYHESTLDTYRLDIQEYSDSDILFNAS